MQKDFKIGMALGLVLVTVVVVWLSARPGLSVKARSLNPNSILRHKKEIPLYSHGLGPRKETAIDKNSTEQTKSIIVVDKPPPAEGLKLLEASANEQSKTINAERFHIVRIGETLTGISYAYYGSAGKWQKILDANRSRLKDANSLRPGMRLTIPK